MFARIQYGSLCNVQDVAGTSFTACLYITDYSGLHFDGSRISFVRQMPMFDTQTIGKEPFNNAQFCFELALLRFRMLLQLVVSKTLKNALWLAGDADIVTISASTGKVRGLFTVRYI
jgi:hypothetical protein